MDPIQNFAAKIKEKANELTVNAKGEFILFLAKTTHVLSHTVGNEIVLATVIPLIPSLIYDSIKQEILSKEIPDLARRLNENRESLNYEFIQSPLGRKIFRDIFNEILEQTQEGKIEYLKSFLINSYKQQNPDEELIRNCQKILLNMEPIHIKLLVLLHNPKEILLKIAQQRKQNPLPVNERKYGKHEYVLYWNESGNDDINHFYLQTNPIVYKNALKDLNNWNIIEAIFHKTWLYFDNTFDSNFESVLRDIDRWTTPFGKRFLQFINETYSNYQNIGKP